MLTELTAISPLDGRYRKEIEELETVASEFALIKERIAIEALYLIALSDIGVIRTLTTEEKKYLNNLSKTLTLTDAQNVKEIEDVIKHDVKAIEKAFHIYLTKTSLEDIIPMLHFAITSEDINNIAKRMLINKTIKNYIIPELDTLLHELVSIADKYKATPMLARTHGQPAVPTTIGKEFVVFALRLHKQVQILKHSTLTGKLNGAVGNFNAHAAAYPDIDWTAFSSNFIRGLGLAYIPATTQINPYEDIIELLQIISRINGILIDFNQDMWRYISDNWFILKFSKTEVGSSTMPQKVNPIDFENSEGNLSIANSIIEGISRNLSTSRLQRDLTDSTLSRNFGVVFGYSLVAYRNCLKGIQKISPNIPEITDALMKNWMILSEAVQTILRSEGVDDPYTLLLNLSKGEVITKKDWNSFINKLPYKGKRKKDLLALSPVTYIGLAQQITEQAIQDIREATDQENSTKMV